MGSVRFNGIRFTAYTMDHEPRHIHSFYAGMEVIVDLRLDGTVALAKKTDAVRPGNGSELDARRVLVVAAEHFDTLVAPWEKHHG